jgi:hypothetical protein
MDIPSLKMGFCLKHLQQASKTLWEQTRKLFFALEKTQEEVGHLGTVSVDVRLASLKPSTTTALTTTTKYAKEDMEEKLNLVEQELLDVALTAIELISMPNCEKIN